MPSPHFPRAAGRLLCAFALVLPVASLAQDTLSAEEQRIVAAVKSNSAAALKLLERAVGINSGTLNPAGVRETGSLFRAELDAIGFTTRWIDMPAAMERGGHLAATRAPGKDAKGKRLLLLGHLDTVFEKDSPVTPWRADPDGKRVWGQGVSDMKGGVVVMVEALRALHTTGLLDGTTIALMLTGDEERVGQPVEKAREDMIALAKASDIALSFEGMSRDVTGAEFVAIARRASGSWALEVKGRQGHSSGMFGPVSGYGAAYELARIVNAFREQLREPNLTFGAGVMLAGTEVTYDASQSKGSAYGKTNIIPPLAMARGDLRYLTAEQGERARAGMRRIAGENLHATSATISFSETYPPMAPTPGNARLAALYSDASRAAGFGAVSVADPGSRGAGDVQFVAPFVDCLDGLGSSGGGAHTPNEFLYTDSIEKNAIRAALMIYRLTR
ncbi:MAG: M20/M25/M40 family metallo-hydrolase [Betaproteobacteria bacterium]|nr:M20/M25/M40 family metallo-hydrolase [Betaproteobacteria bacterium]